MSAQTLDMLHLPVNFHIPVTPQLIFSIAALLIAVWLIFSTILRYHWINYGTGGVQVFTMNFFYLVGSFTLGGLMVISALLYLATAQ